LPDFYPGWWNFSQKETSPVRVLSVGDSNARLAFIKSAERGKISSNTQNSSERTFQQKDAVIYFRFQADYSG